MIYEKKREEEGKEKKREGKGEKKEKEEREKKRCTNDGRDTSIRVYLCEVLMLDPIGAVSKLFEGDLIWHSQFF